MDPYEEFWAALGPDALASWQSVRPDGVGVSDQGSRPSSSARADH